MIDIRDPALQLAQASWLAAIIESSDDAIISKTPDGILTSWNPAAERLFGYCADEAIGRPMTLLFPPDRLDEEQQILARIGRGERVERLETVRLRKAGPPVTVQITISPIRDAAGTIVGASHIAHDITERKRAESQLHRQAQLLAAVTDAIIATDEHRMITSWNPAAEAIYGWAAGEVMGRRTADLLQTEFDGTTQEDADRSLLAMGEYRCEVQQRRKDGSFIPIETIVKVLRDDNGNSVGMVGANRDITARKKAEAEMGRHAARSAALARSAAELNAQLNLLAVLKTICAQAAQALEVPIAIVQLYDEGRDVFDYAESVGLPLDAAKRVRPLPRADYETACPPSDTGLLTILPNVCAVAGLPNAALFAEWGMRTSVAVALRREGHMLGLLRIATVGAMREFDQGELALFEGLAGQAALAIANAQLFQEASASRERLQALSQRLLEIQEAERRLIARQLHDEIGQALTSVKINLQALQRILSEPLGRRVDDSLGIVEETLQRVRSLAIELRPPMLDDLGLAAALRWYVDQQARRAGLQARITANLPDGRLPPEVETACFRVAQEALTNVLRHARATRVEVQLLRNGAGLELVIRDDGIGFDVPAAQAQAGLGGSLGLLGMRERVLLVGGDLKIESTPNHGSRVRVRFPLDVPAPDEGHGAARQSG